MCQECRVGTNVFAEAFFSALCAAGMPEAPSQFSVTPWYQGVSCSALAKIDALIKVFDQVTERASWRAGVCASAPEIARSTRPEVCFFSAWDFHLPPGQPDVPHLIEFNDNGSGSLLAGIINHIFFENAGIIKDIESPVSIVTLGEHVAAMVEREAKEFFRGRPDGILVVLDDADSLERGKFYRELVLLQELLASRGWKVAISAPSGLLWDGKHLLCRGREVSFVVNRSTDFFFKSEMLSPLRAAYLQGRTYVAPNPFTYATRSDKRLLEYLSRPDWDGELGIQTGEREVLSSLVPETWLLRQENIEELARRKENLVFKPVHGFASQGVLNSAQVGRSRLKRLLRGGKGYVAQRRVPKSRLRVDGSGTTSLWTDLRVWSYRGARYLMSGRASICPDTVNLKPPGGWIPTFAMKGDMHQTPA